MVVLGMIIYYNKVKNMKNKISAKTICVIIGLLLYGCSNSINDSVDTSITRFGNTNGNLINLGIVVVRDGWIPRKFSVFSFS